MNWLGILFTGGALAYVAKALSTKKTAEQLAVNIIGITDVVITLWETRLKVQVRFINPTAHPLNITEVSLGLYYAGSKVGDIFLTGTAITVPEKGQITYAIPMVVSNVSAADSFISALSNGQSMTLTVKGYAKANGFTTEINQTVNI